MVLNGYVYAIDIEGGSDQRRFQIALEQLADPGIVWEAVKQREGSVITAGVVDAFRRALKVQMDALLKHGF
jgi:hypothetical protein